MPDRETGRVEAFSDGVFAIAITLLVLDLKVPVRDLNEDRQLGALLLMHWPSYLAFLTSFATILIMWVNHHRMFTLVERIDDRLLFYNGLVLLGVSVVPFPTSLVAEYLGHEGERVAAIIFNGTYVYLAICFNLLWHTCSVRQRLLHHAADPRTVRAITTAFRLGPIGYFVALGLAFVNVTASVGLNLALAIYYALPSRASSRRL